MAGVAATDALLAVVGLTIAGVIKGATGLGYASCALPFLVMALGLKPAMGLVILPALATNISLALSTPHLRETVQRFALLYLAMLPGIGGGLWLLSRIDHGAAVQLLGVVMIAYATLALTRPAMRLSRRCEVWLKGPAGLLNGVVTGLTGAQVMPLFPYIMALHMDAARTVQAINLAVLIASTTLAVGLVASGLVAPILFAWSLAAVVPALIGVEIGQRARMGLSEPQFRRLALFALLSIGFLMLVR